MVGLELILDVTFGLVFLSVLILDVIMGVILFLLGGNFGIVL